MRWQVILAAILIFAAGAGAGAIATRTFAPKVVRKIQYAPLPVAAEKKKEYIERLDRQVQLTPEQRAQTEQILAASQERMKQLWEPFAPQAREEYRRTRNEISAILTSDQKERLEKARKERHQKWREEKSKRDGTRDAPAKSDIQ